MSEYRRDLEIDASLVGATSPSVQIQIFVKPTTAIAVKTLEDAEGLRPMVTLDGVGAGSVTVHLESPAEVVRLRGLLSEYLLLVESSAAVAAEARRREAEASEEGA